MIGNVYAKQGNCDQAVQSFKQSLNIYQSVDLQKQTLIRHIQCKIRGIFVLIIWKLYFISKIIQKLSGSLSL